MLRLSEKEFRRLAPSGKNQSPRSPVADAPYETDEQVRVVDWVDLTLPLLPALEMFFAVPNGGVRPTKTAGRLRAEGVKAGVPDMYLDFPVAPFHGLRIELKRRIGGRLSADQAAWGERYVRHNYAWHVCRGADEAVAAICNYLGVRNPIPLWSIR